MDHINDANKGLEYRVHAVDKALDIVERVAAHPTGIGVAALCKETNISKSTVYSTVATLVDRGFLYRNDDGTIVLGPQLIALGAIARANLGIVSVAQPIMQQLCCGLGSPFTSRSKTAIPRCTCIRSSHLPHCV